MKPLGRKPFYRQFAYPTHEVSVRRRMAFKRMVVTELQRLWNDEEAKATFSPAEFLASVAYAAARLAVHSTHYDICPDDKPGLARDLVECFREGVEAEMRR
ncbi:MAG: hypothetical protein ACXW3D_01255 [Caulobacteraceae bacterium]